MKPWSRQLPLAEGTSQGRSWPYSSSGSAPTTRRRNALALKGNQSSISKHLIMPETMDQGHEAVPVVPDPTSPQTGDRVRVEKKFLELHNDWTTTNISCRL